MNENTDKVGSVSTIDQINALGRAGGKENLRKANSMFRGLKKRWPDVRFTGAMPTS